LSRSLLSRAKLAAALLGVALAGCGFQLRGDAPTGLKTLYISTDMPSQVAVDVRRSLAYTPTRLTKAPAEAEAHLRILTEGRDKAIFTITGAGRVYEFQLRLLVTYQMTVPGRDEPVIPATEIEVRRLVTYSETAPLAKEAEEALLYRDMVADAAGQIIRRMAIVRRPG
jgi:LPS-assembly lipoprotein